MNPQTAMNALKLLERVNVAGNEVDAYLEVRAELRGIVQAAQNPGPAEAPEQTEVPEAA